MSSARHTRPFWAPAQGDFGPAVVQLFSGAKTIRSAYLKRYSKALEYEYRVKTAVLGALK
jgi:hypothetical protein